jgi:hypothetical protein
MTALKSFQRFPAPSGLPTTPADGNGWERGTFGQPGYLPGCRLASSVSGPFDTEMRVLTPSWVVVKRGDPVAANAEHELEGLLENSFTTWTDAPLLNWHVWYDWNFHVIPEPPYVYLRGRGNAQFDEAGHNLGPSETLECEWDTGNFAQGLRGAPVPGGYYDHGADPRSAADWGWPQRGQKVWLTGRWIYDCGHSASLDPNNPNPPETQRRHRTELHPVKAMATLRTEGFKFRENALFVPATQFTFFTCRRGGYVDWPRINDRDYTFLVDLPDPPDGLEPPVYPLDMGAASGSNVYSIGLRSPFLVHWRFFGHDPGNEQNLLALAHAQPRIEPWPPDAAIPRQARVTIPLTLLPPQVENYGVMISLGWPDPDLAQARRVRKVTLHFSHVDALRTHPLRTGPLDIPEMEGPTEEWLLRVGVNGRWWTRLPVEDIEPGVAIPIGWTVELFLADTDTLHISSHGNEEDPVGDVFYRQTLQARTAAWSNGRRITWQEIENPALSEDIITSVLARMWETLNFQNWPLGRLEWLSKPHPDGHIHSTSLAASGGPLPNLNPLPQAFEGDLVLRANALNENSALAETFETQLSDYALHVHLKIEPQPGLPPPA